MRFAIWIGLLLTVTAWAPCTFAAEARLPLRLTYVGNQNTPRAAEFVEFLGTQFERVDVADREAFDPAVAGDADVILLDWSQRDTDSAEAVSPLGPREQWSKPTILLGSAGHLLAGPWEIIGGAG